MPFQLLNDIFVKKYCFFYHFLSFHPDLTVKFLLCL